ncbi:LacI family DNA-binding transcriptional regulator [Fructilactobacillus florum]|uniref:LacI family DNA-binding transcriptional regulator n=1 Tax=Fructilactobacillus florum TaxID=640331 RepID=UPI00058EE170|nr:LacI family DNA-binding transcriptional regulator [Fructilactobacillus florum]
MMKKTTINDIAKAAGVSKTTVSRYLNQKYANMSETTKNKIEATIAKLHYQPNRNAQSLKTNQSYLLGVSVADISNPYTPRLLKGINDYLQSTRYQIMIMDADNSVQLEQANIQKLLRDEIDGLLLQPLNNQAKNYEQLIASGLPTIQVDRYLETSNWSAVVSDNFKKAAEVGALIQAHHYQHVIVLTNSIQYISSRKNRLSGLKAALQTSNINIQVLNVDQEQDWQTILVTAAQQDQKTVIYALNGSLLWETIRTLRSAEIDFPTDVGLLGYDDSGLADLITPGITSIMQNPHQIGKLAACKLVKLIDNPKKTKTEKTEIPTSLIERASL